MVPNVLVVSRWYQWPPPSQWAETLKTLGHLSVPRIRKQSRNRHPAFQGRSRTLLHVLVPSRVPLVHSKQCPLLQIRVQPPGAHNWWTAQNRKGSLQSWDTLSSFPKWSRWLDHSWRPPWQQFHPLKGVFPAASLKKPCNFEERSMTQGTAGAVDAIRHACIDHLAVALPTLLRKNRQATCTMLLMYNTLYIYIKWNSLQNNPSWNA